MATSKQQYLASKYMSGPKADAIMARSDLPKKKKKRPGPGIASSSNVASTSTSFINDDDAGWGSSMPNGNDEEDQDDVARGDAIVASDRSFKKKRIPGGGWETIRVPTPPPADELPLVVGDAPEAPLAGGLLSGDQIKRIGGGGAVKKVEKTTEEDETVHRDSSGRKIDTKAERANAARMKRMQEEKEAQKMEWGKGIVQREEKEKEKMDMEKEKTRAMARYADDADLNADQKGQQRWNDPAAAFLTKKHASGPKKPLYAGPPPPPNRFALPPGYRWDGVDRSNGFEKKLFQRGNERQRRGLEAYEWSVDDM